MADSKIRSRKYLSNKIDQFDKNNKFNCDISEEKSEDHVEKISTSSNNKNNFQPIIFKNISIKTEPGCNGVSTKINQDSYIVEKDFLSNSSNIILGVFDGHGQNGHHVSSYLKKNIASILLFLFLLNYI